MRILPGGNDHDGVRALAREARADKSIDRYRDVRFYLSLRNVSANSQSHSSGGRRDAREESAVMKVSRRDFVRTVALGSAGLVIGFNGRGIFATPNSKQFSPNGWVKIDIDGTVTLTIGKSEMGQGVRTSLAMILADELEADWTRIKLVQAKPSAESDLGTGGSDSMRSSWKPLRQAGAAAREMLAAAVSTTALSLSMPPSCRCPTTRH